MSKNVTASGVPVVILCGGLSTRFKEATELWPKPMVPLGERPTLWHVMRIYAWHGFKRFVLCLGFKAGGIKDYFCNFHLDNADYTINLKTNTITVHEFNQALDGEGTVAYTGEKNMTGSCAARAMDKHLGNAPHFAVTFADGLTDANLAEEFRLHLSRKKIGTVLGAAYALRRDQG